MTEIEWWEYDDATELAGAIAGGIGFIVESALDQRGDCVLGLSGGSTPVVSFTSTTGRRM